MEVCSLSRIVLALFVSRYLSFDCLVLLLMVPGKRGAYSPCTRSAFFCLFDDYFEAKMPAKECYGRPFECSPYSWPADLRVSEPARSYAIWCFQFFPARNREKLRDRAFAYDACHFVLCARENFFREPGGDAFGKHGVAGQLALWCVCTEGGASRCVEWAGAF